MDRMPLNRNKELSLDFDSYPIVTFLPCDTTLTIATLCRIAVTRIWMRRNAVFRRALLYQLSYELTPDSR